MSAKKTNTGVTNMVAAAQQSTNGEQKPAKAKEAPIVDPITSFDGGFFLPLSEIILDPELQLRKDRDPETVEAIRASMLDRARINQHPQKDPVRVVRRGTQWALLAGFTRHELLTEMMAKGGEGQWYKKPSIWCVPHAAATLSAALEENFRENMDRQTMSVPDQAEAYSKMLKSDPSRTIAQLAEKLKRPTVTIENLVRAYRETTPEMWGAYRRRAINQKQIFKLAAIKDTEEKRLVFGALMGENAAAKPDGKRTRKKKDEGGEGKGKAARATANEPSADVNVLMLRIEDLERRSKNWNSGEYALAVRDLLFYLATGTDDIRTRILLKAGDPGAKKQEKVEKKHAAADKKEPALARKAAAKKTTAKKAPAVAHKASSKKGR